MNVKLRLSIFFFLIFILPFQLISQPPFVWEKDFSKDTNLRKVITNKDGIYLIGSKKSTSEITSQDMIIIYMDFKGKVIWEKIYGGSNLELPSRILQTEDGGFLISTLTRSRNGFEQFNISPIGSGDIVLMKFNKNWEEEWAQRLGTSTFDTPRGLVEVPGEGYVVSGWTETRNKTPRNCFDRDIYVAKVNLEGKLIWENNFGGVSRDLNLDLTSVDNKIYVLSTTYSKEIIDDRRFGIAFWLFCLDEDGEELWYKVFPKSNTDHIAKLINYDESLWFIKNKFFGVDENIRPPVLQSDIQFSKINRKGKVKSEKYLGNDSFSEEISHAKVINGEVYVLYYSPFEDQRRNQDIECTVSLVKFEPKKEKENKLWGSYFSKKVPFSDFQPVSDGYVIIMDYSKVIFVK